MNWKNWSYAKRGGVIGIGISLILVVIFNLSGMFIKYFESYGPDLLSIPFILVNMVTILFLAPAGIIFYIFKLNMFTSNDIEAVLTFTGIIVVIVTYFIIGYIIGYLIQWKIKRKI